MFGNIDEDDEGSEDEDYGPKRRRRRTSPDDPSRPRPPRVQRRKVQTSSGDVASKGFDADDVQTSGGDVVSKGVNADGIQTSGGDDASKAVDADDVQTASGGAPKGVDANGVPRDLPSGSQGDGAADGGDREKRMWRRLPDAAVEVHHKPHRLLH